MDIQQLFSAITSDDTLKGQFTDALAAGKEVLEKFLKDHDINAAVEDVMSYVKEHAADLSGIIPTDLLSNIANIDLSNVSDAVSGIASGVAGNLGDEAGEVVGKVAGAVTDALSDGDASDVVEKVTEAVAGEQATGFLGKIKSFFTGK